MGEIQCGMCGHLNGHMKFHNGNQSCEQCGARIGLNCEECRDQVCPDCHRWEHVLE